MRPLVMHVIPGLGTGGAEQMLTRLVTAPRRESFRQAVVDLVGDGAMTGQIRAAGIPVHEMSLRRLSNAPSTIFGLARLIRQLKPDTIQSWLYYADLTSLAALALSGRRKATRLFWGIRCTDLNIESSTRALRWSIRACALNAHRPDAVVANSYAGKSAHEKIGYRPKSFPVIENGINLERFDIAPADRAMVRHQLDIPETAPVVIHAARVHPMKGHHSLIAVARALPDVTFIAAGLGTENLKAPSNVKLLGVRRDMPALYSAADIAISTSTCGEGFPNVVAEAMASGAIPVVTDVGDSARIVENVGIVVAPNDESAMVKAIQAILSFEPEKRASVRKQGRHRIETHFSLTRAVAAFDALHLQQQ